MELSIECSKRDMSVNPRALRREGLLPAVLYGHNVAESVALVVNERSAEKLIKTAKKKALVSLTVPDLPWTGQVVLQEVQKHPWKGSIYHISFFSVPSDSVPSDGGQSEASVENEAEPAESSAPA